MQIRPEPWIGREVMRGGKLCGHVEDVITKPLPSGDQVLFAVRMLDGQLEYISLDRLALCEKEKP